MQNIANTFRPKSFLITVAAIDLISGALASVNPELFSLKGLIDIPSIRVTSLLLLIAAALTIQALHLRKTGPRAASSILILSITPYLYSTYLSLGRGSYQTAGIFLVVAAGIILSAFSTQKETANNSRSLLTTIPGVISIVTGLTFLIPSLQPNVIYDPLRNYIPLLSITFLASGAAILKTTKTDSNLNSALNILLSSPLAFLGIFFITNSSNRIGIILVTFFVMLIVRLTLKTLIGNPDDEAVSVEKEMLNSYNNILETVAVGSLLLFILSTYTSLSDKTLHSIVTALIMLFAISTIIWFHVIPHKFLNKNQLQIWINLYAFFVVVLSLIQSSTLLNPFLLLFAIPIYISAQLLSKHSIIYPTWIAIIGITLAFFRGIISEPQVPLSALVSIASVRYIFVLLLNYVASKIP